jgi:hypothetical protein
MKNKGLINQLKKEKQEEFAKVTLTMAKNGLKEICYHNGEWNGIPFSCDTTTIWRGAELFTEQMTVKDLIDLFSSKEISELEENDFEGLSLVESIHGETKVKNVEWEQLLTEDEEDELNLMDLYWDSDIIESKFKFKSDVIETIKIEVGENLQITI